MKDMVSAKLNVEDILMIVQTVDTMLVISYCHRIEGRRPYSLRVCAGSAFYRSTHTHPACLCYTRTAAHARRAARYAAHTHARFHTRAHAHYAPLPAATTHTHAHTFTTLPHHFHRTPALRTLLPLPTTRTALPTGYRHYLHCCLTPPACQLLFPSCFIHFGWTSDCSSALHTCATHAPPHCLPLLPWPPLPLTPHAPSCTLHALPLMHTSLSSPPCLCSTFLSPLLCPHCPCLSSLPQTQDMVCEKTQGHSAIL